MQLSEVTLRREGHMQISTTSPTLAIPVLFIVMLVYVPVELRNARNTSRAPVETAANNYRLAQRLLC